MIALRYLILLTALLPQTLLGNADNLPIGEAVERHLPGDEQFTQWSMDPDRLAIEAGDRLETREVVTAEVDTVKLDNVVPPIQFESGPVASHAGVGIELSSCTIASGDSESGLTKIW